MHARLTVCVLEHLVQYVIVPFLHLASFTQRIVNDSKNLFLKYVQHVLICPQLAQHYFLFDFFGDFYRYVKSDVFELSSYVPAEFHVNNKPHLLSLCTSFQTNRLHNRTVPTYNGTCKSL